MMLEASANQHQACTHIHTNAENFKLDYIPYIKWISGQLKTCEQWPILLQFKNYIYDEI